jgi:peptidoglycan hydrolase CwlO-like protein
MIEALVVLKTMKQKSTKKHQIKNYLSGALLILAATLMLVGSAVSPAKADSFDQQIAALQQANAANLNSLGALQSQAASYQDAINQLQAQINALQQLIDANLTKQHDLQAEIDKNQAELDRQRELLGQDIKSMYVDGQPSSIEILASSKNLSDFVDKEEYRTSVQKKIQDTLKRINDLQVQLGAQKQQVDQLLSEQKDQQSQLDSDRATQASMLSYNQSQQAAYNNQISANQAKIADLRRQQAIANSQFNIGNMRGDPGNGGYPSVWANARQDSMVDSWGMYNRECVSYTAYMVHQDYLAGKNSRDMPYWGGRGNANQWDDNARAAGIPVDNNPTPGSIAISNSGTWGHAMYVASVGTINGQQAIYVQQFNAQLTGQYSEGWRYTSGLVFLHF